MNQKTKLSLKTIIWIVIGVAALAGIAVFAAHVINISNTDKIYPNVYAAGINLGGMTESEAVDALNRKIDETYGDKSITVNLHDPAGIYDRSETITDDVLNIHIDAETVAEAAAAYGKDGSTLERYRSYQQAAASDNAYTVTAGIAVDEDAIRETVHTWEQECVRPMEPCTWHVDDANNEIVVEIGQTGYDLDEEELTNCIVSAVFREDYRDITVDYARTLFPTVDLSEVYDSVNTEVADAYYDKTTHRIVHEVEGYGFDLEAATQEILLSQDGATVVIPMETIYPEVTQSELEKLYFADEIGYYQTSGLGGSNRSTNIRLAVAAINDIVIEPGETFSYNQTLGQRTAEKGYKMAGAYVNGKSVTEIGGGICQVSTTLYNAVLLANLEIVARSEHIYAASYVPLGLDATVSWGGPDFQFRNNTDYPIRINAEVDNGYIKVSLYGTATGYTVQMRSETLKTIPYTTLTTKDEEEVNSTGRNGYTAVTYRDVYDSSGELISSSIEDYSYYSKMDIVVLEEDVEKQAEEKKTEEQNQNG